MEIDVAEGIRREHVRNAVPEAARWIRMVLSVSTQMVAAHPVQTHRAVCRHETQSPHKLTLVSL